jgi:hypothetical protein
LVRDVTGESRPVFVLSLGTPGCYRKLTIQVMRPSGEILGYVKLPLTEAAGQHVRHEAEVLKRLAKFPCLQGQIPKVLYTSEWEDRSILFQSPGPPSPGPENIGQIHLDFLQALWSVHRVARPGHILVEEVATRCKEALPVLDPELQELGHMAITQASQELNGAMIPCGITHGDFAPWNTRAQNGHLFLFDWEWAIWETPILWDLFHFEVQVASLLHRRCRVELRIQGSRAESGNFLLYVLSSLCRSVEEGVPPNHPSLAYRRRLLVQQLSKGVAKGAF